MVCFVIEDTKEVPTRCRTPSSGGTVGAVLDSSGNIVVYGSTKSSDTKRGVLSQLIDKARTKEDRKKSPGREERDRSRGRSSRKSPDNTKPKTPPGHSKVRSLYRSLKGAAGGDTSNEALDQDRCGDQQQATQQSGKYESPRSDPTPIR